MGTQGVKQLFSSPGDHKAKYLDIKLKKGLNGVPQLTKDTQSSSNTTEKIHQI